MKYVKLFAMAVGALLFTACSDDNNFNTASDVTVQMGQNEISVVESRGIINVPIQLSGQANGSVKVEIKVEGTGEIPAAPFEEVNGEWTGNYILSSNTINFPEGETNASVEINLVDDYIETGDHTFTISIVSAEGATIGAQSSTTIVMIDNEAFPAYDQIQGNWKFKFTDFNGNPASYNLTIEGYEEGTQEYADGILDVGGFLNNPAYLTMYLTEDEATGKVYVEFRLPESMIWFDAAQGLLVWGIGMDGDGELMSSAVIRGEFDKSTQTITFNQDDTIGFFVAPENLSPITGIIDSATAISMTR